MAWLVTTLLLVAGLSVRQANQRIETITLLYTYVVHVPSKSMPAIYRVHGRDVQSWYRSLVALKVPRRRLPCPRLFLPRVCPPGYDWVRIDDHNDT